MSPGQAHRRRDFFVSLDELRGLANTADLGSSMAFVRHLHRVKRLHGDEFEDPRADVYLPRSMRGDIMMAHRILDTTTSDIYFDRINNRSRGAVIPRLQRVLSSYKILTSRRNNYATHRRHAIHIANSQLSKSIKHAKSLLRRILRDVFAWRETHIAKDRWRAAFVSLDADLARFILYFEPPRDDALRAIQTDIFEEIPQTPPVMPVLGDLNIEKGGWHDALTSLIPALRRYLIFFDPPADEEIRAAQANMLWSALYDPSGYESTEF